MVIPENASNPELAHKFMEFITSPEVATKITEYVGYRTVVQEVYDDMVAPGGMFEGNVAYSTHSDAKLEEFYYNAETRDIMSRLWTTIKVAH